MVHRLVKTTVDSSYSSPQRKKRTKQAPPMSAFKGLTSSQLRKILGAVTKTEVTAKP
jgi:hypothetical protein